MSKPRLRISLSAEPERDSLVAARTLRLREGLLARLLGKKHRVAVLVPGDQIGSVEIVRPNDDLTALAKATGVMGGEVK